MVAALPETVQRTLNPVALAAATAVAAAATTAAGEAGEAQAARGARGSNSNNNYRAGKPAGCALAAQVLLHPPRLVAAVVLAAGTSRTQRKCGATTL